jgi:hypothetical protein
MPCSIAVGIACMNDELLLGLRYRKSQFDAKSITQFAALLKQTMVG